MCNLNGQMTQTQRRGMDEWVSSPEYTSFVDALHPSKFLEVSDLLLERPNLNSSHLFRADILSDSAAKLQTTGEKERLSGCKHATTTPGTVQEQDLQQRTTPPSSTSIAIAASLEGDDTSTSDLLGHAGLSLERTVVRELIPRKPHVDAPLRQSCLIYQDRKSLGHTSTIIVVYVPHATSEKHIPWYHPCVQALAYQYQRDGVGAKISVHYKPFPASVEAPTDRLHRTFLSLLQTFVRLARIETPNQHSPNDVPGPVLPSARPTNAASLKDTILPQHVVQNTYSRLKQIYAADLIARWTEKTDPAKHVFEDIAIAAFLLELWRSMYRDEVFPGFVDTACGNGVLVYLLVREGFRGYGFDARRRKTWEVLGIDDCLFEKLCIPKPLLDTLDVGDLSQLGEIDINNGIYNPNTFIIANHADELTPWTPILAALSSPTVYLPFLAIPCCSHALSGSPYRYTLKDVDAGLSDGNSHGSHDSGVALESGQPHQGDLKALRAQRAQATSHSDGKSAYACLTKKTVALAEELDFETEMTLMRIPSTRNIGIVGNRHRKRREVTEPETVTITRLLERECSMDGGIRDSAKLWVERARRHLEGKGRGKVNLKGPMSVCGVENGPHCHDLET